MPILKNTKRYIPAFLSLALLLPVLNGCFLGKNVSNANKAYEIGEYNRAASQYKRAYSREKNRYTKGELSFYMGECYRTINIPRKAASYYSKSVRYKFEEQIAELYMADMYLAAGKYEEALEGYESYLEKKGFDRRASNGIASCKLAMDENNLTRYQIQKIKGLSNTRFSDYSPGYAGNDYDQVYFSSMRTEKKSRRRSRITGQGGSNLYVARIDAKGKWTEAESLGETINTEFDEGAGTLSSDGKDMYFTRCKYDNEKPLGAEMLKMSRTGGKWSEPEVIQVKGDSLLVAHPAISNDGNTLYFVSDMPGGVGGKDLWKAEKGGEGGWADPVNMGEIINTPGDEMFPYVRLDGTLFFASNAHIGYGGLDIYKAVKDEEDQWQVINLGRPINSESDDFGIVYKGLEEEGLFSSSRGSSKGVDNIYSFVLPKLNFEMRGEVRSQKDNTPITDAYLRLIGTDGTNLKLRISEDGSFGTKLNKNTDYVFMVAAKGYFNQKEKITTVNLEDDQIFEFNMEMIPMEDAIVLKDIFFEEDKADLNSNAQKELNRLAEILEMNQAVVIEVGAHTSGEGDETESIVLSQQRAQAVMDYLLSKGIATERLSAKGYGDTQPVTVNRLQAKEFDFLKKEDVLNKVFIQKLRPQQRKKAHQINRRIEFKIKE